MDLVQSIITRFREKRKGVGGAKVLPRKAPGAPEAGSFGRRDLLVALLIGVTGAGGFLLGRLSADTGIASITINSPEPVEDFLASPMAAMASVSLDAEEGPEVVASVSGSVYHLPECSGAKRIKPENIVTFASPAAAEAAGYRPAANCPGLE